MILSSNMKLKISADFFTICVPRSKYCFCLRHFQVQNLDLIQFNFYIILSIFVYHNGSNKKATRKSFKGRIN